MIRSKQELRQVSERMSSRIKADMRTKIVEFLQKMGTSQIELANALDITVNELNTILEGNGEITLTTFAKILVASNHSLEIRKIPANAFGGRMPNRRREQMQEPISHMRGGERIPSFEEFDRMVREGKIPPPPRGMNRMRGNAMPPFNAVPPFCQHVQEADATATTATTATSIHSMNDELDSLTREQLINLIVGEGLEEEFANTVGVRCEVARRSDMIYFLSHVRDNEMQTVTNEEEVRAPFSRVERIEPISIEDERDNITSHEPNVNELASALAQALSENPSLRSVLRSYLS